MMNCFEKIRNIFERLSIHSYANVYTGHEWKIWATYNLTDRQPVAFSDNDNPMWVNYVQAHLFLPITYNYFDLMARIADELKAAGFTPPDTTVDVESENKIQHLTFSCQIVEE